MTLARAILVAALLVATSAFTAARTRPEPPPAALATLPQTLDGLHGVNAPPLDAAIARELGADTYVTRTYEGGALPVGLYIAYYAQQRPNVSIHSPLNCLPGTGWEPLEVSTVGVGDGSPARVRRMLVRKALDRAVVLYWYAIHGRSVADEIASRFWLLRDSVVNGRSDAALVRVTVPVDASVDAADAQARSFARALLPHVTF